jgi:hypothetical protein
MFVRFTIYIHFDSKQESWVNKKHIFIPTSKDGFLLIINLIGWKCNYCQTYTYLYSEVIYTFYLTCVLFSIFIPIYEYVIDSADGCNGLVSLQVGGTGHTCFPEASSESTIKLLSLWRGLYIPCRGNVTRIIIGLLHVRLRLIATECTAQI